MGYGYAAVCIIEALQKQKVVVNFLDEKAYIHISFVQPEMYQSISNQYRIGYTPWESTEIPLAWVAMMKERDEIWTTSKFCQDIFANYDIPSVVVPHGIDPEIYKIYDRTLTNRFIFLHIGSPTERKGSQMVVDAFVELFSNRDDVGLMLKSTGPTNARWIERDYYHGNANHHPRINVIEHDLTLEDMTTLYNNSHCCVYPSNGEGFGLIPYQAIATGLPTIVTDLTGTADFAHYSMPLKATWGPGEGVHIGEWAVPDFNHLCELMSHVVENWEEEKKKAMNSARIIHSTQTWDHIADQMLDLLGDKVEQYVEGWEG
jgi:glycosyltransferase involved in cell wall biosynthesis